jgi:hypothetical protein
MPNINVLDSSVRRQVLDDINTEENYSRKREAQRRFDVYRGRQDRYILETLQNEFSVRTVQEMRTILSINMTEKIIGELSSIYKNDPDREYGDASDNEKEQIENLYAEAKFNSAMKVANKYYNLFDDVDLLVLPKDGKVQVKPLTKMGYDIVPDAKDPEKAFALILSTFDDTMHATVSNDTNINNERQDYYNRDNVNQKTADDDDRKKLSQRYIWWTDEFHFTTDGFGNIIEEVENNPIEELPLVNIATEKDNQYFVRRGAGIVNFAIAFSACLSDLANLVKLQGYAQAVITSTKQPTNLSVGPNKIIWLEQDPQAQVQPTFEFVSPNPDIANSLEFLETLLRLFLTSRNIDPKSISGKLEGQSFSSGVERLLAMIDRFSASQDDVDLFRCAEDEVFGLITKWSNVMQGVNDETRVVEDLNVSTISDDVTQSVKFNGPEAVKTEVEELDIVERRMENGTMSVVGAIVRLDEVDKERAKEILEEIKEEDEEVGEDDGGEINEGTDPNFIQEQAPIEVQPEGNIRSGSGGQRPVAPSNGRSSAEQDAGEDS